VKEGLNGHPADRDMLLALIAFSRTAGDAAAALAFAARLAQLSRRMTRIWQR